LSQVFEPGGDAAAAGGRGGSRPEEALHLVKIPATFNNNSSAGERLESEGTADER
jgi:hypothetical protein